MRIIFTGDGPEYIQCFKEKNWKLIHDNTKQIFFPPPVILDVNFNCALSKINSMGKLTVNQHVYELKSNFHHDFFTPCRHIAPTNRTYDVNIYPVIGGFLRQHNACRIIKL